MLDSEPTLEKPEDYQTLGIMSLLDIDQAGKLAEFTIEEYYHSNFLHITENKVFVAQNEENRFLGYAILADNTLVFGEPNLARLTAPRGGENEIVSLIRDYLANS